MSLTSAAEALRLPSAQLTEDETKIVDKLVALFNDEVTEGKMKLSGMPFETNNNNPNAMTKFLFLAEEAGYAVQCQADIQPNRFNPKGPPTINGYRVIFSPTKESIAASLRTLQ